MAPRRAFPAIRPAAPRLRSFAHRLGRDALTTVHVAEYPLAEYAPRVVALDPPQALAAWCAQAGEGEALVGGFFMRPAGTPLGELWIGGARRPSQPFSVPGRSCFAVDSANVRIGRRVDLPEEPRGDLLQAGPLLRSAGVPLMEDDPEGFSSGAAQFDSDITVGRYPRAALGVSRDWILAVACDGRAQHDAGMTLRELAELMAALGADRAINLDGGGSTSLVHDGMLRNVPREEHGIELVAGRPVANALVFEPA